MTKRKADPGGIEFKQEQIPTPRFPHILFQFSHGVIASERKRYGSGGGWKRKGILR